MQLFVGCEMWGLPGTQQSVQEVNGHGQKRSPLQNTRESGIDLLI